MKTANTLAALLLAALLFTGCSGKNTGSLPENPEPESKPQAENVLQTDCSEVASPSDAPENTASTDISAYAKQELLLPLEDFSWEREYPAEYVMLHFTSNVVSNRENPYDISEVRDIFQRSGISINYIIARDGTVYCWIPESRAAWHAGKGEFAGDSRYTNAMNRYSIGIELLAVGSESDMSQYLTSAEYRALDGDIYGFTDSQYTALKQLVQDICTRNGIPFDREHIIGHDEYNPAKSDPGELFEWDRLLQE